jgi:hypothetical protein
MRVEWEPQEIWHDVVWQPDRDACAAIEQILEEERLHIHYLDGVAITGSDYPLCLENDAFDCDQCQFFFDEDECKLRRSKKYRKRVWGIIEPWVLHERKKNALRQAVADQLQGYGRALHYSIITRMVQDRYPQLNANEGQVLRVLWGCPDLFQQLGPGRYKRRGSA